GLRHIPQHSDCRVLDQLLYKWAHFKPILTKVMGEKLADLLAAGLTPTRAEIERDVHRLLNGNFWEFVGRTPNR
ncbi:MAG: glucuronate isomerase, partial [Armatimonadetes bacterium]|nr:glucuronate isomerase [Armatimonadota bacterium]